ncbi:hypothetical protein CERZMDRAFT_84862 [Cercospora zeae-maydis SCOH1-5]|uniref:Uncharacterized protein n=1 Tax=Cercospora zeae-maydis SCOH1-5 TaxID=717836 RepID=A0A6A6FEL9_9PEZI|nr:hypothetical protein CERZMDRAFT_84862 [Cercospora zeae-maydis SCOH1-5]
MPQYNSAIAREILSEPEKDRLLAVALNTVAVNAATNWEKASAEFGAASVDSMRVSIRNIHKKLDKAGANADGAAATPDPPKAKQRKTSTIGVGEPMAKKDVEPKAKKPRTTKKKLLKHEAEEETAVEQKTSVKEEAEEEEE